MLFPPSVQSTFAKVGHWTWALWRPFQILAPTSCSAHTLNPKHALKNCHLRKQIRKFTMEHKTSQGWYHKRWFWLRNQGLPKPRKNPQPAFVFYTDSKLACAPIEGATVTHITHCFSLCPYGLTYIGGGWRVEAAGCIQIRIETKVTLFCCILVIEGLLIRHWRLKTIEL